MGVWHWLSALQQAVTSPKKLNACLIGSWQDARVRSFSRPANVVVLSASLQFHFSKLCCFFFVFVEPQSRALRDQFFGGKVTHQPGRAECIVLNIKTRVCVGIESNRIKSNQIKSNL